jgi:hypothetical protein
MRVAGIEKVVAYSAAVLIYQCKMFYSAGLLAYDPA